MKVLMLAASSLLMVSTSLPALAQNPAATTTTTTQSAPAKNSVKKTRTPAEVARTPVTSESSNTTTAQASATRPSDNWAWTKQRLSVGGFVSSASDLSLNGTSASAGTQTARGSGNMSTSSALGVEAQLIDYKNENWGWFGGASIEQSREIGSINLSLSENNNIRRSFSAKPRYRPLVISGGGVYRYSDNIYATAGLNYTLYNDFGGGDFDGASMDAKPGYQFAVAFKPAPRFAIEVAYKDIRYSFGGRIGTGQQVRISSDDMILAGMAISGRYSLE